MIQNIYFIPFKFPYALHAASISSDLKLFHCTLFLHSPIGFNLYENAALDGVVGDIGVVFILAQ